MPGNSRKSPVKRRRFKSPALKAIHEAANALAHVRAISKPTMRGFDSSCLAPKLRTVVTKRGLDILS